MHNHDYSAEGAHSFAVFVSHLEDGDFNVRMSQQLQRLTRALQAEMHEKGVEQEGALSLTLKFSLAPSGLLTISYDSKLKLPSGPKGSSVAYATAGGNVTFVNPRQQELGLREVKVARATKEA